MNAVQIYWIFLLPFQVLCFVSGWAYIDRKLKKLKSNETIPEERIEESLSLLRFCFSRDKRVPRLLVLINVVCIFDLSIVLLQLLDYSGHEICVDFTISLIVGVSLAWHGFIDLRVDEMWYRVAVNAKKGILSYFDVGMMQMDYVLSLGTPFLISISGIVLDRSDDPSRDTWIIIVFSGLIARRIFRLFHVVRYEKYVLKSMETQSDEVRFRIALLTHIQVYHCLLMLLMEFAFVLFLKDEIEHYFPWNYLLQDGQYFWSSEINNKGINMDCIKVVLHLKKADVDIEKQEKNIPHSKTFDNGRFKGNAVVPQVVVHKKLSPRAKLKPIHNPLIKKESADENVTKQKSDNSN